MGNNKVENKKIRKISFNQKGWGMHCKKLLPGESEKQENQEIRTKIQ